MTVRTLDRASEVYTIEKVGRTQEMTPEGYLLCRDVPVARTGEMLYAAGELSGENGEKIEAGPDGIVRVTRNESEVFRPETIASANGKPVTIDHPPEDVSPANWATLAKGIGLNPHHGTGVDSDLLLVDFLVTDPVAITMIRSRRREISCGYDASYEQTAPGRARQFNIVLNHFALVESGRCGPVCATGDSDMATKVKVTTRKSFKDRMLDFVRAKDEEGAKAALEGVEVQDEAEEGDGDGGDTHIHVHVNGAGETKDDDDPGTAGADDTPAWFKAHVEQNNARFKAIEDAIAALKPAADPEPKEGDQVTDEDLKKEPDGSAIADEAMDPDGEKDPLKTKDGKTRDAAMRSDFQDAVSRAELIIPGVKLPTYDAADPAKATCLFRRRVLYRATTHDSAGQLVERVLGKKPDFKAMTCDAVKVAFNAVAELARSNNNGAIRSGTYDRNSGSAARPKTNAEINKANDEFWAARGAR